MSAQLLHHLVAAQAETRPEATALVMADQRMTYGALEAMSNRLARLLRAQGCREGDRVCLLLPKSLHALTAIQAVLKAGCVYVPMDPASPALRAARIVESCRPRAILITAATGRLMEEIAAESPAARAARIGLIGPQSWPGVHFEAAEALALPESAPDVRRRPEDAAHILFTSGSTGLPKGVVITHANALSFVEWGVDYFGIGKADRLSGHPPLHFDLSTFDMFGSFRAGAELHLVAPELNLLPNKLAEFIRSSGLTQWFSVPSVMSLMAKAGVIRDGDFPSLKRVLWCGEVLPTSSLIHWMRRLPHARFTNLYGPTEATIASSYYTVPACPSDERAAIPIGRPCGGEDLLVLDEEMRPTPPGEVGDLYIAGVGLSPGYWQDPEKTRGVFLPHPFSPGRVYKTGDLARLGEDGLIHFVGRADSQIKSRGYRIELGEIEAALDALGILKEAAVVAVQSGGFDGATICCAYVPAEDQDLSPKDLRKALSRHLPVYMLPTRWAAYRMLPKNANGKIDRPRLKEDMSASPEKADA